MKVTSEIDNHIVETHSVTPHGVVSVQSTNHKGIIKISFAIGDNPDLVWCNVDADEVTKAIQNATNV